MRIRFTLSFVWMLLFFGCNEEPTLLYSKAETEAELGSRQKALDHLMQIQRVQPEFTDAYLFAAKLFVEDRNFPAAIKQLKRGLDAGADSALITRYIGQIYHDRGDQEEAYRYYLQALKYNPDREEIQVSMGRILHDKSLYDRALTHYEQAMQINPKSYSGMVNKALTLGELDRTGEAIELLETAIDDFPMDGPAYGALAYVQEKTGTVRDAIEDNYALAVRLSPRDQGTWKNYLTFLEADSNYHRTVAVLQRYTRQYPDDIDGHHRLAAIYMDLALTEGLTWLDAAAQECDRALLLDKDDDRSHGYMARIYLLKEKPRLAVLEAKLAFEIKPTSEYRELIREAELLLD